MSSLKSSASLMVSRLHRLLTFGFLLITGGLFAYYFFALSLDGRMDSKAQFTYAKIVASPEAIDDARSGLPALEVGGKTLSGWGLLQFSKQFGETCLSTAIIFALAYTLLRATSYVFDLDLSASYSALSGDLLSSDILQMIPAIALLLLLYAENAYVLTEPLAFPPVVSFGLINATTPQTWMLYATPGAFIGGILIAAETRG